MKSDVTTVLSTGEGRMEAVEQTAASAAYRGLNKKNTLQLRLLAEELLGMLEQITGNLSAEFWVESRGGSFELHLTAARSITSEMRKELLNVSSSGKNSANVGIMGKLKGVFEQAILDSSNNARPVSYSAYYMQGLLYSANPANIDPIALGLSAAAKAETADWSMRQYKHTVAQEKGHDAAARDAWDELEKSIIANLADEITVSIRGSNVEMVAYKSFPGVK